MTSERTQERTLERAPGKAPEKNTRENTCGAYLRPQDTIFGFVSVLWTNQVGNFKWSYLRNWKCYGTLVSAGIENASEASCRTKRLPTVDHPYWPH